MVSEIELSRKAVPINKIPKYSIDWMMCVLINRKGSVISYKNSRHEGTYQMRKLVDDEVILFVLLYATAINFPDYISNSIPCPLNK